jgi:hypothetical protein
LRFGCPSECWCAVFVASSLGRLRPPRLQPFLASPRGFSNAAVPCPLVALCEKVMNKSEDYVHVGTGSSSRGLTSSSKFQSSQPARNAHKTSTSLGVFYSIATSGERVHHLAGIPIPTFVPSLAFLALSTVYSSLTLAGIFHPATTSEFSSSGVFPTNQRTKLSLAPALLSFAVLVCNQANPLAPTPTAKLQGFIPTDDPLPNPDRLKPVLTRSPLEVSLPQVFLPAP